MRVTEDIKYVGVNDHQVDLFEGQYEVPLGMAYNSYVIMDDRRGVACQPGGGSGRQKAGLSGSAAHGARPLR